MKLHKMCQFFFCAVSMGSLLLSCKPKDSLLPHAMTSSYLYTISPSFCYWKTTLSFSNDEMALWKNLSTKHLYVRLFDVGWNVVYNQPSPCGDIALRFDDIFDKSILKVITPCIFITNDVMERSTLQGIDSLVENISVRCSSAVRNIASIYAYDSCLNISFSNIVESDENATGLYRLQDSIKLAIEKKWLTKNNEIVIDCDWSTGTREKYFRLLSGLQKRNPQNLISVTLRLWQFKHRQLAGVPPVNRCLLMCYSVGNPRTYGQENSIASVESIKKYLSDTLYPKRLDIALPIYNWALVYRGQSFKGFIKIGDLAEIESDTVSYKKIGVGRYLFKQDTVIGTTYLRSGDELKFERVSFKDLTEIMQMIKRQTKYDTNTRITFFSWDTTYIKGLGSDKIKQLYSIFN